MDNSSINRSGFTITGFSKTGFACCSHWQLCNMGKEACYYSDADPEAKDYCFAYKRHSHDVINISLEQNELNSLSEDKDCTISFSTDKQLSLF